MSQPTSWTKYVIELRLPEEETWRHFKDCELLGQAMAALNEMNLETIDWRVLRYEITLEMEAS